MRDKILARLKAKFPGVNLSKLRLDAIADKLAAKITDENEIDGKLDELNDYMPLADIAKQDDRIRALEAKNREKTDPKPPQDPPKGNDDPPVPNDVPEWAKPLIQGFAQLNTTVSTLQKEKVQTSIADRVSKHEKLKGIPALFYSGRALPEKDEEIDAFADKIATDHTAYLQTLANEGFKKSSTSPAVGGTVATQTTEAAANIKAWADQTKPATDKK